MTSPFPGMDPYLEPHWLDVHTALVGEARRALNRVLPEGLVARVEERVVVESEAEDRLRRIGPDARVIDHSRSAAPTDAGAVAIEAPYKLVVEADPIVERFVRVIDDVGQVVTVIEFVSPTNKREPGLGEYRERRAELLAAGVHVVEVDLVRSGDWRGLMRPETCPAEAVSTYRVTVRPGGVRAGGYLFPIRLGEALPEVPIPLRPSDQPVRLPLQEMIEAVYADGRYDRTIDYSLEPEPPLTAEESARAREWLTKSGRR